MRSFFTTMFILLTVGCGNGEVEFSGKTARGAEDIEIPADKPPEIACKTELATIRLLEAENEKLRAMIEKLLAR